LREGRHVSVFVPTHHDEYSDEWQEFRNGRPMTVGATPVSVVSAGAQYLGCLLETMRTLEPVSSSPSRHVSSCFAVFAMLVPCSTAMAEMGPALTGITARANDATSVFWSPAGITRLERPELVVQSTTVYKNAKFDVDQATFDGGNADRDEEILAIPAFYYAHPINDRWFAGASLTVPSGIGNNYGNSWAGRYLAMESELAFVALQGTAAYRISDQWSIGGGPLAMYTDSTTKARVNNLEPGRGDGTVKLEEQGMGVGYSLGAMFEPVEGTRLAAVYRSEIDPDLNGKPKFDDLGPLLNAALEISGLDNEKIDVDFKIPEQLQVGLYHELTDRLSLTVDGIWINMSRFGVNSVSIESDSLFVQSDYRDMYVGSAGLKYYTRPDLALSIGALYATSPISDSNRTVGLPLDRTIVVGGGLEWQLRDDLVLHSSLNYIDLGDGEVEQDGGFLTGTVSGSFRDNYAIALDLQITKRF
jgi:long-chain fatty acid transport protein